MTTEQSVSAHYSRGVLRERLFAALTEDGVVPAVNATQVKAGSKFTKELFNQLWDCHNEWTTAFFAEQDRRGQRYAQKRDHPGREVAEGDRDEEVGGTPDRPEREQPEPGSSIHPSKVTTTSGRS